MFRVWNGILVEKTSFEEGCSYEDRLRILGLTTLETRFLRADLIEVFKILRGFENLDPDIFFQVIGDVLGGAQF